MIREPSQRASIAFFRNSKQRFILLDRDLLSTRYDVTDYYMASPRAVRPLDIWRTVATHDLVFCWFASWHSVFPIIFAALAGKPSILVAGGYDVARLPAIDYGNQREFLRRSISRLALHRAKVVLAFSEHSRNEAIQQAGVAPGRVETVYLGVPDWFGALPPAKREIVLTVGGVDRVNLERKGHLRFIGIARLLPDIEFVHVGKWRDDAINILTRHASANVSFTGWLTDPILFDTYARAAVYVQLSLHEGFGLSVGEAMVAGAVPVVSKAGALPELVGDAGSYVDLSDPKMAADVIRSHLRAGVEQRQAVREQILCHFPLIKRQRQLHRRIDEQLAGASQ